MKKSREKAYEWLKLNARGAKPPHRHDQDVGLLAYFIEQEKAKQREACGKAVYELLSFQSVSQHWPNLAKKACEDARIEE